MLAIVASMERELSSLRRRMKLDGSEGRGEPVHFCVTGVGKERALDSIQSLLDGTRSPGAILCLGFAGGLRDELRTGDLVIARRLYATGEEDFVETEARLAKLAHEALDHPGAPPYSVADGLTVPRIVATAAEKRRLARDTSAWAVNMEDYWIGMEAARRGIPFLSVRAVLDTADQDMPPLAARLGNVGTLAQALQAAAAVVARPWSQWELVRLFKQMRAAQDSLAAFGVTYVPMALSAGSYASN